MLHRGSTFLLAAGEDSPYHLHVVVTEPLGGEVVVVSITTRRAKSESLVVLHKGDHPFIEHDSVPAFFAARIFGVVEIEAKLASGLALPREAASEALTRKLFRGLIDSDRTPNDVRQYCKDLASDPGR